jgi:probable rRNA maturation factor
LGLLNAELSILLTTDATISDLNHRYLGKEGPTNVLAFPMSENRSAEGTLILGDVVVSVETALKESNQSGKPLELRVFELLIHGVLHLMGHDHEKSPGEARRMRKEEERLLSLLAEDNKIEIDA